MGYKLFTDICCDLPLSYIQRHDLTVLPFPMTIEEEEFAITADPSEPKAISPRVFYDKLRAGIPAKTAQLSLDICREQFERALRDGQDILYIAFTSGLSGSYGVANLVAEDLRGQYPERKILVVDSLCASMGQGLLVHMAIGEMERGADIESLARYVERNRQRVHHWVVVDDLAHLRRGGRVSGPVALIGTLLGIKPILIVDSEGRLPAIEKVQGRKRALKHLVDQMERDAVKPVGDAVFISHSDCEEDAKAVADMVRQRLGAEVMLINFIGPIIGAHTGPGTVALFFVSDAARKA